MKITHVFAEEILDSRGNPTVTCTVTLENGQTGSAQVPSGASTGSYEAVELRDADPKRFAGQGVLKAVSNVNDKISTVVVGLDASEQEQIDQAMILLDGTPNKANLGANAILSVSLAVARAAAVSEGKQLYQYLTKFNPQFAGHYTLPIPMMNIMNGGKHAGWATDIQEYMILPIGAATIADAVRMGAEVYSMLKSVVKEAGFSTNVGDEGGFAPAVSSNRAPFDLMSEAIKRCGYNLGTDIVFGIDAAATEFFKGDFYELKKENQSYDAAGLIGFYEELMSAYPIVTLEDIFAEDDWAGFASFNAKHADKSQLVGDDLYVTNIDRLSRGVKENTTNSVLIKLNQIGTLTETIKTINMALANKMSAVISHRSGETTDDFIADLSVALGTDQIKTGAPARSERTAKYNRLMQIERMEGDKAKLAKWWK